MVLPSAIVLATYIYVFVYGMYTYMNAYIYIYIYMYMNINGHTNTLEYSERILHSLKPFGCYSGHRSTIVEFEATRLVESTVMVPSSCNH